MRDRADNKQPLYFLVAGAAILALAILVLALVFIQSDNTTESHNVPDDWHNLTRWEQYQLNPFGCDIENNTQYIDHQTGLCHDLDDTVRCQALIPECGYPPEEPTEPAFETGDPVELISQENSYDADGNYVVISHWDPDRTTLAGRPLRPVLKDRATYTEKGGNLIKVETYGEGGIKLSESYYDPAIRHGTAIRILRYDEKGNLAEEIDETSIEKVEVRKSDFCESKKHWRDDELVSHVCQIYNTVEELDLVSSGVCEVVLNKEIRFNPENCEKTQEKYAIGASKSTERFYDANGNLIGVGVFGGPDDDRSFELIDKDGKATSLADDRWTR